MKCENNFCIYQSGGECNIDRIYINNLGMCSECIYPDINENVLNEAKLNLLKKYNHAQL